MYNILTKNLSDTQTTAQLVNYCLLSKFYYTLSADVFSNEHLEKNIYKHNTNHTIKIKEIIKKLCKHIAGTDNIPQYAI